MGWQPRPRWDDRRKRYTCTIRGEHKYLGRTYPAAVARLAALLQVAPGDLPPERAPVSVAGLIERRRNLGAGRWERSLLMPWDGAQGEMPIADVTTATLAEYGAGLAGRGLAPQTVHHHVNAALKLLAWAVSQGWLDAAPVKPKLPRPQRRPRDQRPDVAGAVADKLEHAGAVVRFIMAVGCRPAEACRLRWEHVDLDRGVAELRQHKTARTGAVRQLFLTPDAIAILGTVPRSSAWVFVNSRGDPYTPAGLRSMLYKAGLRGGAYSLRHTAAQGWLDAGVSMEDVAGLLGHKDLRTVVVYAQVRADRLRRVASSIRPSAPGPAEPQQQPQPSTSGPAPGLSPRRASKPKPKPGPRKAS